MQIALTFDDGPHPLHTRRLFKIASAYDAKLTFFTVGSRVTRHPAIVQDAVMAGHEIGNHSWSHRSFTALTDDELRREVRDTQDAIASCGATVVSIRPPYGAIHGDQRELIKTEFGLSIEMWSVDARDWQLRDATDIARKVLTGVSDGSVVLAHDIHQQTVAAMEIIIPSLRAAGYHLVTLSNLKHRSLPTGRGR